MKYKTPEALRLTETRWYRRQPQNMSWNNKENNEATQKLSLFTCTRASVGPFNSWSDRTTWMMSWCRWSHTRVVSCGNEVSKEHCGLQLKNQRLWNIGSCYFHILQAVWTDELTSSVTREFRRGSELILVFTFGGCDLRSGALGCLVIALFVCANKLTLLGGVLQFASNKGCPSPSWCDLTTQPHCETMI